MMDMSVCGRLIGGGEIRKVAGGVVCWTMVGVCVGELWCRGVGGVELGRERKVVSSLGVRPKSNMRWDAANRLVLILGGRWSK